MANPQRENGHVDIANELVEQLAKVNLSAYEWRVLMVVLRKTYGWQKKADFIPVSQIAKMTGMAKPHACRSKQSLLRKNVLAERSGKIGLNKDYDTWAVTNSGNVTNLGNAVTNLGNKTLPVQAPQKKRKKTIQKKRKSPLLQIFTHWNSYKGRSIRKRDKENQEKSVAWKSHTLRPDGSLTPDVEKAIAETMKAGHSVQNVCGAIDNYAKVLLNPDYWWTHVWPLSTFLMVKYERRKDAEHKFWQFLPDNFVEDKYIHETVNRKQTQHDGPNQAQHYQEEYGFRTSA